MQKETNTSSGPEPHWVEAKDGYRLALEDGKLVCQNAKGKRLKAVPKAVKSDEVAEQLVNLRDWLNKHVQECRDQVELWILRSLPVSRELLTAVWEDPAWREPLENVVVMAMDSEGAVDAEAGGFLRGAEAGKGVGVVNLDGETLWLETTTFMIPHPVVMEELNDFRELATELGLNQAISQLFRETWTRPVDLDQNSTSINEFADGTFEELNHVLGKCRTLGYRVRGGFAICQVWERGAPVEARFWIGADYPEEETYTGGLGWVDSRERTLKLSEVGPVAYSEGIRMASAIYAARVVDEQGEDE